jgi:hypothetical protein
MTVSLLPQRRRARWILLLTALLAMLFLLRALLPWSVAKTLAWATERQTGEPLRIGDVDLWLLRGRIALKDVALGEDPESLHADRAFVNLDWAELFSRRLHLQDVDLDGAELRLTRGQDGRLEPLSRWAGPGDEPGSDAGGAAWPILLERLSVRDAALSVAESGAESPALHFTLGALALRALKLDDEGLSLADVDLSEPRLRVARRLLVVEGEPAPASPDQAEAGPQDEAPAEADVPAKEPQAFHYRIDRLRVGDAEVDVEGASAPFELGFDLEASDIGAARFPLELEVRIDDGTLRFDGEAGILPPALEGQLTGRELPLSPFALLSEAEGPVRLQRGHASADLELRLEGDDPLRLHLSGGFALADLELASPDDPGTRVAWKKLALQSLEAELPLTGDGAAPRLEVGRLELARPEGRFVRKRPDGAAQAAEPAPDSGVSADAPVIRVAALGVEGGDFRFRDESTSPPFETRIHDVQASATELHWPESRARGIELRGVAPETATFNLTGSLEQDGGALRLEVQHLSLPPLDPYVRQVGYAFHNGELSLDADARIRGDAVDMEGDLVLHDLGVDALDESRFQAVYGLSLPLAVALLRDPKGNIQLAPRLHFEEDALQVGMASVLQDAMREAIQGALTTPIKGLGAVLARGGDQPVDLQALSAVPGDAELAEEARPRIEELARLLKRRPGLGLVLHGRVGEADRTVLAERIRTRRREDRWLMGVGAEKDAPVEVPEADLLDLAGARAERLQSALVDAGVPAERLRPGDPRTDQPPGVAVELFAR